MAQTRKTWRLIKLERHEKSLPQRHWQRFAMTRRGRMSWADWVVLRPANPADNGEA